MNNTELEEWHDKVFWPKYCHLVVTPFKTDWGPGGKGESKKKIMQLKPSEDMRKRIELAIDAQTRHKRILYDKLGSRQAYNDYVAPLAKGGESIYKNRQAKTWIYNYGWDDEIPEIQSERQQIMRSKTCKVKGCDRETHGPMFSVCSEHLYITP